ncbi:hypothetical protein SNOG_12333 [Parastagonospora nodorum SN15]|uniref:Uncharacterized protein n=1 Tax=Phaeosphaeria nodorum (strain SN15 / ATCC MYA-4574 / FGSC 10173) TaxID=321614 RepID=Q0U7D1_PHANO|nr:hypothetical protein SNOG_12333 [Parastagonospora nodorum SN15]EAT80146.1 hypothetical protein SNOG_12333 [Parastagonospora nodorum SN15]
MGFTGACVALNPERCRVLRSGDLHVIRGKTAYCDEFNCLVRGAAKDAAAYGDMFKTANGCLVDVMAVFEWGEYVAMAF